MNEGSWKMFEIKRIDNVDEVCVMVIRSSFRTVADEFGLTRENAPTNAAFIELDALTAMRQKGAQMYGGFCDGRLVGFVAVRKAKDDLYYMEKLAVLPDFRHRGYGRQLVDFAVKAVREAGGRRISIGIINENTVLKEWYKCIGFIETETRQFPHLPFTVCHMELAV